MHNYLFKSQRLGYRNWQESDIELMYHLNQDEEVMRYFPGLNSMIQTKDFITRMQNNFKEKRYCYFAVDRLDTHEFIGFIGIMDQTYEAEFTPCIDIGWRLAKAHWGKGFATEGAEKCLDYAFKNLNLKTIYSVATANNIPSINVMKKIGMRERYYFDHPKLLDNKILKKCVLYCIEY